MQDGGQYGSKRPKVLALVKDGRRARETGSTTLPIDAASVLGEDLAEAIAETTSTAAFGPAPVCDRGTLTVVNGADAGSVWRLGTTSVVGRAPDCEIHIDHAGVSRRHARIVRQSDTEYVVQDLGSHNGTTVRGQRITRASLVDGDRIGFGPVFLRFALADENELVALKQRYEFSVVDGLTGAINRRHFDDRMIVELAYAKRHRSDVCLLMLDIDHFKAINDALGHQAGDSVLRQLAHAIKSALRVEDVFARYGGEEFAILARGIDGAGALAFAERLRRIVEEARFTHDGAPVSVTVSIGTATLADCSEPSADQLLQRADSALYVAKAAGRNCCRRSMP